MISIFDIKLSCIFCVHTFSLTVVFYFTCYFDVGFVFEDFFDVDHFLKSVSNLLQ